MIVSRPTFKATAANAVWSPSTQKRSLRLDLGQSKSQGDESASTSGKGSPTQSSTRESSEATEEPSPSVWQPFGAPSEIPQFRSVKLDGLPSKPHSPANQPKTSIDSEETKVPSSEQVLYRNDESTSEIHQNGNVLVNMNEITSENRSMSDSEIKSKTFMSTTATATTNAPTTAAWNRGGRSINLPPSQSPTITLLQKAREGQIPKGAIYIDEKIHDEFKAPLLPKDAVLIDQKVTIDGDKVHTDSYYAIPSSIATGEVTTHILKAPPKYDGIGPTEYGIPVGLRTAVKDEYASDWYKTMYRSLHKSAEDARAHSQMIHLGGYMSEPEYDRRPTYRPDYATLDYQRKADKYLTSREIRPASKSPEIRVEKVNDEYLSDGVLSSRHQESYKNQPRSIAEYEPGHSSLADREFQKFWDDFWDSMEDLNEYFRRSPRPQRSYEKRWPNSLLCDGYESDSTLIRKTVNPPPRLDPEQQKAWYKEIQKGGDIPLTGLRKPAPEKPKEPMHQYQETEVNIHYKSPIRSLEKEYIEEEELRKRQEDAMRKFYAEERQKKQLQQAAEIEMRRHSDNFTPSQKSPIPLNRYDNPFEISYSLRNQGSPSEYPRTLAQVLYPFVAQSTRELSLSKGDIVYINRQIDKNWYEGEHHGFVGIFPVAYVAVIPTEKANLQPKKAFEGHGMVKYSFRAKTPMELSVFKGERVILTRRVDQNWYEGRIGTKKGIIPVSYVDVLQEPGDSNLRGEMISPKPPASPVYGPIINGNPYRPSTSPTYVSSSASLQRNQIPDLRQGDKLSLTQSLHVDTYNEPIPYRSLYSYHPQNDDELELREGDTVYVMEKCDDGWYVGTSLRTGLFGTFPGNYVERI